MHLIKPSWLAHQGEGKDQEIYSLSISRDGKRLATGGQDCKVRIWSTDTIYKALKDDNPQGQKQLCSMSNHNGAVTVVRFSPSGEYLASGSDDRVVLIWAKDDSRQPRQEFGQQGEADSEAWVAQKRLTAHENDVQDLAWSPDGSLLVTVGLDSSIIIWNGTTFEKMKVLNQHGSHVKGITFDPANKYFATASDDRTVKIFRYHRTGNDISFQVESTISAPFTKSPLSTYFRRLTWAPDGTLIAAPNATNGPVATTVLIERGTWESDMSLIGHDAPCEVVMFCGRVFTIEKPQDYKDSNNYSSLQVVATASQDKSLAIWTSAHKRPIAVAKNVCGKAITDMAWSPDGTKLLCSSLDGSILLVSFEEGELGYPLPDSEIEKELTRYGGGRDALQIAESTDQVRLEESIPEEKNVNEKKMDEIMGNGENGNQNNTFDKPTSTAPSTQPQQQQQQQQQQSQPQPPVVNVLQVPTKSSKQNVTITKDGKKRLTPQLITTSKQQQSSSSSSSQHHGHTGQRSQPLQVHKGEKNLHVVEMSSPSYALPKGGVNSLVVGNKRKFDDDGDEAGTAAESNNETTKKQKHEEIPEFIKPVVASPAATVAAVRLGAPKVRTFFASSDSKKNIVLEVRNGTGNEYEPTRIIATKQGEVLFVDFLPKHGHLAAGNGKLFWAVATEDGVLYLYSPYGKRLMPSMVLGSPISFLESSDVYLLAITSIGMAYVWDIKEQKALHEPISLAPILDSGMKLLENGASKGPSITQCSITKTGKMVITLNNGNGYTYNHHMHSWSRISEEWWSVGSQYWDSSGDFKSGAGGIVGLVEKRTTDLQRRGRSLQLQRAMRNRSLQAGYEAFEPVVSTSHLENKMGAAILLESKDEFKDFLLTYAYHLAEQSMADRLEDLLKDLLGPTVVVTTNGTGSSENGSAPYWQPTVCGFEKRDLLKLVINKIGRVQQVQRVVNYYSNAISAQ